MTQHYSRLEDLPLELFHLIFDYLAPHHLLYAFKNLNKRFTTMLKQQPLYLPNNRMMNFKLYHTYCTEIIPDYSSKIVYLHLSERHAPHAVDWFVNEVPLDELIWSSLKAVTIEDIPRDLFETLNDSSLLTNIHSLSIDISCRRYHHYEYEGLADYDIVIPLLNRLHELRSLNLQFESLMGNKYTAMFMKHCHPMEIHQNLQSLSIEACSTELLIELLDDGHLLQLRRLNIALSSDSFNLMSDSSSPITLKQVFVPELRHISIHLSRGVAWVLTYFEDLQRHNQLEQLNISGHIVFNMNGGLPRAAELQRWLTLTKSKVFAFQLQLDTDYKYGAEHIREEIFAEYRKATGDDSLGKYGAINIYYPKMSFSYPRMKINDINQEYLGSNGVINSNMCMADDPVDDNMEEMDIYDLGCMEEELLDKLEAVPRWHRLKKIKLYGDVPDENGVVGDNIPHLIHIAQRSPRLRELYIGANLNYGHVLSSNVQLGILLASQLEILYFAANYANSSLGDLVQIVDTLFGYSTSPPCLKQLTLNVDGHPSLWVSTRHLVRWISKVLKRFPALIHFTLYCEQTEAFEDSIYSLSELADKWYAMSSTTQQNWSTSLTYRHKPHSLDIWL